MSTRSKRLQEIMAILSESGEAEQDVVLEELIKEAAAQALEKLYPPPPAFDDAPLPGQRGWHVQVHRVAGQIDTMDFHPVFRNPDGTWPVPESEVVLSAPRPMGANGRRH